MDNLSKKVSSFVIPDEWELMKLEQIISDLEMGQAPPSNSYNKEGNGEPFVKVSEFGEVKPNVHIWTTKPLKIVDEGLILFSVAGTLGLVNISIRCAIGRSVVAIKPIQERITTEYLFYFLKSVSKNLRGRGSTQKIIVKDDINNIQVLLPPINEQKLIVSCLSTVDNAIQKSDAIIFKTEHLKKGLMQKFFENTKWRSEALSNEKIFKLIMGQSPPSNTYNFNKEGLPFYQGNADFGKLYPNPRICCNSPLKIADEGDILISIRAPVGELNIADKKCCIGRGLAAIRIIAGDNLFYYYYLNYIKNRIQAFSQGSTFKAITAAEFKKINVPIPDINEQKKITDILSSTDKKLDLERKRKEKLETIKKGLMNDLLTGKKRVRGFENV